MTTFFTADTHFGHARIVDLSRRPFEGVVEMREALIRNWNAVVRESDDVWHLGDFAYRATAGEAERVFERLNGRKHLVVGNHDGEATCALPWASVQPAAEIAVDGQRLFLAHYPMLEWPGYWRQAVHLFGHVHGNRAGVGRSCDVGVDAWGYRPVRLSEVLRRIGDAVNE
ncbi:metallophosphoesterase family protein [Antarcticirhabdus aurantiaca]|uniref:metallophosphoesterase family protein n=1 Tax=Antarcticirhabdus aurantiaca TaxID=2606717 RepID=UPI00131AB1B6|nr:metallophosphoesterase [Antarcticirhabdus aurantiaca]